MEPITEAAKVRRRIRDLSVKELGELSSIAYAKGVDQIASRLVYHGLSIEFSNYELLQTMADVLVERAMHLSACVFEFLRMKSPDLDEKQREKLGAKYASAMWIWGLSRRIDGSEHTKMGDFFGNRAVFCNDLKAYYEHISAVIADAGSLGAAVKGARNLLGMASGLIEPIGQKEGFQAKHLFHDEMFRADEYLSWLDSDIQELEEMDRPKEETKVPPKGLTEEQFRKVLDTKLGDVWTRRGPPSRYKSSTFSTGKNFDLPEVLRTGGLEMVQATIANSAEINTKDSNGVTPLMWAASRNPSFEAISSMSTPEQRTGHGEVDREAIVSSAASFNLQVISSLLKVGARIDDKDNEGATPLMFAAAYNQNPQVISALLEAGAKINTRDKHGFSPLLHSAATNQNPEVAGVLLKAGARIDDTSNQGVTCLMWAAAKNWNPKVVCALLEAGAKIDARDARGLSPLMYAAATNQNPEVISALLDSGASVDERDKTSGTPLMCAAESNHNPEVLRALLRAGARVDDRDETGQTALILAAAKNKNPEVLSALLKTGAAIDEKDNRGLTPLMWAAAKNQNPEVIATLLKAGANGRLRCHGKTAFDYAAENRKLQGTDAYEALDKSTGDH
jgi:ankyrin repeat protein